MFLQRYVGLNPKIINNTCNTEENGTATYIERNPHDVDNMATNITLIGSSYYRVLSYNLKFLHNYLKIQEL